MVPTILFDAFALGQSSGFRGMGTYEREVLAGLGRDARIQVRALTVTNDPVPEGVEPARVRRLVPERFAPFEHEVRLPFDIRHAGGDLFHSPAQDPPARCRLPWVQTLYDVIPLVTDETPKSFRRRFRRLTRRFRRADAVICISRHAADEGIRVLDLDPRRLRVVPLGVNPVFRPNGRAASADPPYLLFVSEYSPRKGYEDAFEVIAQLADAGFPHRLRIAGRIAPWVEPTVKAAVERAPRSDRVELLGYVDDLPALYRGADLLLFPSRYEGFGLPPLEAMACGIPVVAYDNTSIPEVVGDAGVLVPDGDRSALAEAVKRVLSERSLRDELAARAIERAARFTWSSSVDAHIETYLEVLEP
jgi:glycosyltransferase involved in cell wall biosynthesis